MVGAVLSILIGRSIVRPISAMTTVMGKLAAGEYGVVIPSRDSNDEMGAMAKAVEVFKHNGEDRSRLETEQKAQEQRAAEEKHAALVGMAEKIETESTVALQEVGVHTAAIASTAEEMSASAMRTGEAAEAA